jgi:hypothetical protein
MPVRKEKKSVKLMPKKKASVKKSVVAAPPAKKERTRAVRTVRKTVAQKHDAASIVIQTEEVHISHSSTEPRLHVALHRTTTVLNRVMMVASIAIVGATLALSGMLSFAEKPTGPLGGDSAKKEGLVEVGRPVYGANPTPAYEVVGNIISIILSILGIVFTILIIYAGFLWMTDQGKSDQTEKAMSVIQHSIFGLIVVVAAYLITNFVLTNLAASIK